MLLRRSSCLFFSSSAAASAAAAKAEARALASSLAGLHLINGVLTQPASGQTFAVRNPATGEEIARAAEGDERDVDRAVAAAAAAQVTWAREPARARAKRLLACADTIRANAEQLARLTSLETGKALRTESRVEASLVADIFTYYAGLCTELKGETLPFSPTSLTFTLRVPVGVVAAILPWNAPLLLLALKCAPALACGNTVVLKSAEEAPFGALRLLSLLAPHLPPGAINCLAGHGQPCGSALVAHPQIGHVTFTGSVETGRTINAICGGNLVGSTLELGGKSPMIVCADYPVAQSVKGAVGGMRFTRQGQSCTAASRILVERSVLREFVDGMAREVDAMVMGDPMNEETDIGTLISHAQRERVLRLVRDAVTRGAQARECGALPRDAALRDGLYMRPVIMSGAVMDSEIVREEVFGPVTCVFPFDSFDDAIRMANDTRFGLSATVWTNNMKNALRAAHEIDAGIVQINQNAVVQPNLPVGGMKISGMGREASLESMLEHFTHRKTVSINMN